MTKIDCFKNKQNLMFITNKAFLDFLINTNYEFVEFDGITTFYQFRHIHQTQDSYLKTKVKYLTKINRLKYKQNNIYH